MCHLNLNHLKVKSLKPLNDVLKILLKIQSADLNEIYGYLMEWKFLGMSYYN